MQPLKTTATSPSRGSRPRFETMGWPPPVWSMIERRRWISATSTFRGLPSGPLIRTWSLNSPSPSGPR
jgi:hypothetical protein